MNSPARQPDTQAIVVDEVFPHAPETIWKALTTGDLIARWLMAPQGFEPVAGNRFTFQTKAAGEWDGVIHCQVQEVVPCERFVYSWQSGNQSNEGYGAPLDTLVTWTLSKVEQGTRVRLVHSGFVLPKNDTAYRNMGDGWKKVVRNLDDVAAEEEKTP
jgi:uncharacterized protein YndB with AHSA1/START domain